MSVDNKFMVLLKLYLQPHGIPLPLNLKIFDIAQMKIIKEIQTSCRGKGLIVTENVNPNSILIRVPEPYVLLPDKASLSKICSWCMLPISSLSSHLQPRNVATLKKCSACKIPQYCSSVCQRADWKSIHAKECKHLKKLPDIPPTPVRAVMQVLFKYQLKTSQDLRWMKLEGHEEKRMKRSRLEQESWEDILLQAKAAMSFSGTEALGLEMATAILCRISSNAFRATLPDATAIGLCFEPAISLVNHSCTPNAHVVFEGRVMTLQTLIHVKSGEELFISYIDVNQPWKTRKEELWKTYFFLCRCPRCEEEEEKSSGGVEKIVFKF